MKHAGVFIGANSSGNPLYSEITEQLASILVQRQISVVYGGAAVGLMGVLADTVLKQNGQVVGVMPAVLSKQEISHHHLTQLHQVDSMQERKKLLAELSDFFIIMPGGLGTLEEFFEIWNAAKIGLHQKPIGLLNVNGYFDDLLRFIQQAVQTGFMQASHFDLIKVSDNPAQLLDLIKVIA